MNEYVDPEKLKNEIAKAPVWTSLTIIEMIDKMTKTQTETQNSNLTFKTLEYCDICDHKGCEECIANALDEHCMPSQFKKQIEDECAKEYEELGLKELKELIEADRKTEPQTELVRVKYHCINCAENGSYKCSKCDGEMHYKYDKDEPQICDTCRFDDKYDDESICKECSRHYSDCYTPKDEPQTDCAWAKGE